MAPTDRQTKTTQESITYALRHMTNGNTGHPIWFILGFSGAGKSHFLRYVAARLGWLPLELDQPGMRPDQILGEPVLLQTYTQFAASGDPTPFIEALNRECDARGKSGVIIGFRSVDFIPPTTIEEISHRGVKTVYLVADAQFCLRAFLERERGSTATNSTRESWLTNNGRLIALLADPEMDRYTVPTFDVTGQRLPVEQIFDTVSRPARRGAPTLDATKNQR